MHTICLDKLQILILMDGWRSMAIPIDCIMRTL